MVPLLIPATPEGQTIVVKNWHNNKPEYMLISYVFNHTLLISNSGLPVIKFGITVKEKR